MLSLVQVTNLWEEMKHISEPCSLPALVICLQRKEKKSLSVLREGVFWEKMSCSFFENLKQNTAHPKKCL